MPRVEAGIELVNEHGHSFPWLDQAHSQECLCHDKNAPSQVVIPDILHRESRLFWPGLLRHPDGWGWIPRRDACRPCLSVTRLV